MKLAQISAIDSGKIRLHFWVGGELTVHTLPSIQRVLLQQLNCCREIEVDFSEVRVVDTMSVRAILAIRREALQKDQALYFVSRNEAFLKLLDLMYRTDFGAELAN